MQSNDNLRTTVLQPVENLQGITSSKANQIADFYRAKGGFKIEISEHQFRADIVVTPLLSTPSTTYQARRVN